MPAPESAAIVVEACTDGRVHVEVSRPGGRVLRFALEPGDAEGLAGKLTKRAEQARRFIEAG